MDNLKFAISYSCGKDSTLSLHRMIKSGYKCESLLVTIDKENNSSFFHGVPVEILENISRALDIKLTKLLIGKDDYREVFVDHLKKLSEEGVRLCVFGDIDINEHRQWCTEVCLEAGMAAVFPLWQENRESLVSEFIDLGYKAIIKTINSDILGEEILGEVLDHNLVEEIVKQGSDACGENGEYHTVVIDGPLFKNQVNIKTKGLARNGHYASLLV
ncbi:MAG: diphthine--ammonia ligase [Filifactoraceae bacterium]